MPLFLQLPRKVADFLTSTFLATTKLPACEFPQQFQRTLVRMRVPFLSSISGRVWKPPPWISCFSGLAGDEYVIELIAQKWIAGGAELSAWFKETARLRVRAIAGRVEAEDKCDQIDPSAMP